MSYIYSFPPIAHADATLLILGSMPGEASLHAGEYYAHPRNHFWRLMGALLALDPASPYEQRIAALKARRFAVWDVLHGCVRAGSLDANIEPASQIANDFESFFARHARITHVFFNGSAAEQIFRRRVLPLITLPVEYRRLPSTSPANAALSFERKLDAWQAILQCDSGAGSYSNSH